MAKRPTSGDGWELIRAGGRSGRDGLGGGGSDAGGGLRESAAPGDQKIRVQEEKRAKGKVVTVARGFLLTDDDLKALAKRLKAVCGAGGKADGDAIEVQGRHAEKLRDALRDAGYTVR